MRAFGAGGGLFIGDAWARAPVFDLGEGEGDGARVAVGGEGIDPGAAGVAEAEQLGDLVVGFAGCVVDRAAYVAIGPGAVASLLFGEVQVRVAAGDDEGQEREFHRGFAALARLHQDGVDVAFEVVDRDQRLVEAEGEGLGVGDADEQCTCEARAFGDGDGVEVGEGDWMSGCSAGAGHRLADDRYDVAEVFAGREFGDDAAVVGVEGHLRGDDV